MTEPTKIVESIEILHLDKTGYGPNNSMTRREWRNECYNQLKRGPGEFNVWHGNIGGYSTEYNLTCDFSYKVIFDDGTSKIISLERNNPCYLDFIGVEFEEVCVFEGFVFYWPINFSFSKFYSDTSFAFQLHEKLYMQNVEFRGQCQFKNINSTSPIVLKYSNFQDLIIEHFIGGFLDVSNLYIDGNLEIKDCSFSSFFGRYLTINGTTTIENTTFNGTTYFNYSEFREGLKFSDTVRFKSLASFDDTNFYSFTQFEKVEFADVSFNDANFNDYVTFRQAKFKDACSFVNATFNSSANFQATFFSDIGRFEGAKFVGNKSRIPSFRGVKNDTRLEFSQDSQFTIEDASDDAIRDLGLLKKLSDEHGQTDQALNFNAMELRAKRKNTWQSLTIEKVFLNIFPILGWRWLVKLAYVFKGQFWFCVFTWIYEVVSDFGRSFTRPLLFLISVLVISYLFAIVSAFELSPARINHSRQPIFDELSRVYVYTKHHQSEYDKLLALSGYRAATEYSLYRSGSFLGLSEADKLTTSVNMRLFGTEIEPAYMRFFGLVKGIITAILLFLIGLGLRNKYRVS